MSASFFAAIAAICFFCFLFSFFINCPFSPSCRASRDYANDVLGAYREHYEGDGSDIDGGHHNKAAFLIAVQLLPHRQHEWVIKNKRGSINTHDACSEDRLTFYLDP